MITNQLSLNEEQVSSFARFLMEGSDAALHALQNLFGLDIDSADASIEITPALSPDYVNNLGDQTLYTVSSAMVGELQGSMLLLMRSEDFQSLGDLMRPVLSLLFMSGEEPQQESPDNHRAGRTQATNPGTDSDTEFRAQMLDVLTEMGNVLIGLYTKAIYNIYSLNTHHSIPLVCTDESQETIRRFLTAKQPPDQMHLVIENEFTTMDHTITLWCLISPSSESFNSILNCIENHEELFSHPVGQAH
ncbi:MAG: hypothetical protein HKO64_00590 [Xanthomonadales bacterium]|nr:hypothetical protein [Gammaproteobacteria bacterium]NNE04341.1 hypothetical protein [Xanthomonadales bacterium]NNL94093.1 hypothetical protein [Xanthomonadales bacterium]